MQHVVVVAVEFAWISLVVIALLEIHKNFPFSILFLTPSN